MRCNARFRYVARAVVCRCGSQTRRGFDRGYASREKKVTAALKFFAAIDQDDTNWIAHLYDVAPTGLETRIARGFLKASHRALDPDKSKPYAPYHTHTRAEPVVPGEIYEYDISFGHIVNVFKTGHRIKLVIDSRESPRDPEMQIHFHPHLCSSKPTLHKIYRNKEYRSRLILPILSKHKGVTEMLGDDNLLQ